MMLRYLLLLSITMILSCKTSVPTATSDKYLGDYNRVDKPASRMAISKEGNEYKINFKDEDKEWDGAGYEVQGKLIAVLKNIDEEEAEFATLSLSGEDQLFVVARYIDGSYKWDGYFKEAVE